ncbi:MAG: HAD family hydrolase [Vicinamibacteria bacterium]
MRARGFVFDLDGTLVDNMGFHAAAFVEFVARHGLPPLSLEDRARFDGRRNRDIFPDLFGRALSDVELARFSNEKETLYRETTRGRLRPLAGLLPLLDRLEAQGLAVAVATSSPEENVVHTLLEIGLAARLRTVVRSDEVAHGKPFPDVFLEAARRSGVRPADCVAFEDAPLGVTAARTAGMRVVAVTTSFSAADFARHGAPADEAVADYHEYLRGPGAWLLAAASSATA